MSTRSLVTGLATVVALPVAVMFAAPRAQAGEAYNTCTGFITSLPAVIASPGVWCMDRDLSTAMASGNAITINANRVTIDCNQFKLGGLAAGPTTTAKGIYANNREYPTVRNCNIRGFHQGIDFYAGWYGVIEDNRLEGNLYIGINQSTQDGIVRRNRVMDTGLASGSSATGIWLGGADGIDNIVSGVIASSVVGIAHASGSVIGNTVTGLAPGSGLAIGVECQGTAMSTLVQRNRFIATATTAGTAIRCVAANQVAVACRENVIVRFATPHQGCDALVGNRILP